LLSFVTKESRAEIVERRACASHVTFELMGAKRRSLSIDQQRAHKRFVMRPTRTTRLRTHRRFDQCAATPTSRDNCISHSSMLASHGAARRASAEHMHHTQCFALCLVRCQTTRAQHTDELNARTRNQHSPHQRFQWHLACVRVQRIDRITNCTNIKQPRHSRSCVSNSFS
jgi:hypothetical protein